MSVYDVSQSISISPKLKININAYAEEQMKSKSAKQYNNLTVIKLPNGIRVSWYVSGIWTAKFALNAYAYELVAHVPIKQYARKRIRWCLGQLLSLR